MAHDALLYVSFGGPDRPEDVMPFLENVVAGRDVPRERLEEVADHYHEHGGRSPINDQNRAMIAALEDRFAADGPDLPILFGNRNWSPTIDDALREADAAGHRRLLAYVTSAYASWSGCRQYREDIAAALERTGVDITVDKIRTFHDHPGFVAAQVARVDDALAQLPSDLRDLARLVFVTHSIPERMARHSAYVAQHLETAQLVADGVGGGRAWDLVFCSRSGPPHVPWLEPDVGDHLAGLAQDCPAVVVVPIGFLSDHMEVLHDLDVEAAAVAAQRELPMVRAGTVGTHPAFVDAVRELVLERTEGRTPRGAGSGPTAPDSCPADCCRIPTEPGPPAI